MSPKTKLNLTKQYLQIRPQRVMVEVFKRNANLPCLSFAVTSCFLNNLDKFFKSLSKTALCKG